MDKIFNAIQVIWNLNNIKRTGPMLFSGIPAHDLQSISEHSFVVVSLCLIFGGRLDGVRLDKLLSYALTHDWAESITGDTPSTSLSYKSYFDLNIREAFKSAEGKAKASIFSDAKVDVPILNEVESNIFGFCDVLARILEVIELKQRGYKSGWLTKFYKVQHHILKQYKFPFVTDIVLSIDEIFNRGYMENTYLTKETIEFWQDEETSKE